MSDVIFWVNVPEADGTTGLVEINEPMANALYEAGLREFNGDLGHVENSEGTVEGEDFHFTIEWDNDTTEVTLGDVQVPTMEAAATIGLGFLRALVNALDQVKAAQEDYL